MEGKMTRLARVVAPGYPHHITQRGNRRQPTFFKQNDYKLYLTILKEQCDKFDAEVWAYCLMPNHVHLVVVPNTEDSMRKAIGETHRRYTRAINERMEWRGYLWQGRFASFPLDESYLLATVRYVELNPVKAGLVASPEQYMWSSARFHLGLCDDALISRSPLRDIVSNWQDFLLMEDNANEQRRIRVACSTGQPLGTETFLKAIHIR
jgi:putative transposase